MAGHHLINTYLADLAHRLPPEVVDELADGLDETFHHHLADGLDPAEAAIAATTEFGDPTRIAAEFIRQSPARRTALAMLATGPVFAALWGMSLITAHAWTWTIPAGAVITFAAALLIIVGALLGVVTGNSYGRTRPIAAACVGMIALDITMIITVVALAPALTWPIALAVPASMTRITVAAHRLPQLSTI